MPGFFKPLWVASAALALAAPLSGFAQTTQNVPPGYNESCNCYRNVSYGSTTWFEPTTKKITRQVMDIYMPQGAAPAAGWPVAYFGHPNGMTHYIAKDSTPGSRWATLVQPLLDAGYIVVSYEFRHPVVNYVDGQPAPKYDIRKAINAFATTYATALNADVTNSFITGTSRGGGLGLLTALTSTFKGGTKIRALWVTQAQTTFDCQESADTFVLESDRAAFLASCRPVPNAGSSLASVHADAPPVVATYERPFHKTLAPASEVDIHYPDFGWQLCMRYQAQGESAKCAPQDNVAKASAWNGLVSYFNQHKVQ